MNGSPKAERIREAGPADAAALLALKTRLDEETSFMLLEPGERNPSVERLAERLAELVKSGNSVVMVAEDEDEMAGYVELDGGTFRRNRQTSHVIIGILARAGGRGLGGRLMAEAETWAREHGAHRLELNVMAHNSRAIALYDRMGFTIEGKRRECLLLDGRYADEFYMAKILDQG